MKTVNHLERISNILKAMESVGEQLTQDVPDAHTRMLNLNMCLWSETKQLIEEQENESDERKSA